MSIYSIRNSSRNRDIIENLSTYPYRHQHHRQKHPVEHEPAPTLPYHSNMPALKITLITTEIVIPSVYGTILYGVHQD